MNAEIPGLDPNPAGHPSRLSLGRLLAGDLDDAGKRTLEAHIGSCLHCSGVFENAKLEAADFARRRPTLQNLGSRGRRPNAPVSAPGWRERLLDLFDHGLGMRPAVAGFALLALVSVLWMLNGRINRRGAEDLTAKGSPQFIAYLNGKPVHGDTLFCAPFDTLQLAIVAAGPVHYAVLYRDDGGALTTYMLDGEQGGYPLGTPRGEPLPHSLVLGKGWQREILYCIWSSRPFTLAEAEGAVAEGGSAGDLHTQIIPLANHGP